MVWVWGLFFLRWPESRELSQGSWTEPLCCEFANCFSGHWNLRIAGLRRFARIARTLWKVRVGFGQNGFSADFCFWAARFFRGFCRRIFSFSWEKCPERSSRKIPGKILQNLYNKNPWRISAKGPGQEMCFFSLRIDSIELLGFALRIARPSKFAFFF